MEFFPITQQSKFPLTALSNETLGTSETAPKTIISNTPAEQAEDFDTFLTLLTAQISNQDPLEPVDSTQFVEQLATFSNLELQAKNNQILEGIATLLQQNLAPATTGNNAPVSVPNPEALL